MIRKSLGIAGAGAATAALVGALLLYGVHTSRGSDHQDSPTVVNRPGADITDVFVFPAPDNDNNVVLVMDVYPLIPAGQGPSTFFDPAVLYQFKIDNVGDHQEHLVIQFLASPSSSGTQTIGVYGPTAPRSTGTNSTLATLSGVINYNDANATINGGGIKVFAGPREDPFFFDLARFFQIIPDRNYANQPSPPAPTASSFRGFPNSGNFTSCDHTASQDFLSANQFNVLSFVVELPRTALAPNGGAPGKIGVWATTSTTTGS